jgi:hypothetical protein
MCEQEAQQIRKAQYPLANRPLGKDLVHQQRRTLDHAPGEAAAAEPLAFAVEVGTDVGTGDGVAEEEVLTAPPRIL